MTSLMDRLFGVPTDTSGGARAKEKAKEDLAQAEATGRRVDAVTASLRGYRERNHLAEQIECQWRKRV